MSTQEKRIMKKEINGVMRMQKKIKKTSILFVQSEVSMHSSFFPEAPLATSWKSVFTDLSFLSHYSAFVRYQATICKSSRIYAITNSYLK